MRNRNEIDPSLTWDLTPIFPSVEAWENELKELSAAAKMVGEEIRPLLLRDKEGLKQAMDTTQAFGKRLERLYLYAMLDLSLDNSDPERQAREARVEMLATNYSSALAYVDPLLLTLPAETLEDWTKDTEYAFSFRELNRGRAHVLSEKEEQLLALLSDAEGTPSEAFDKFESVDLPFPPVKTPDGEKELTHATFASFRESPDRAVRTAGFETYFGAFKQFENTLAALYTGAVKSDNFHAKIRRYASACDAALFANNVPVPVYDRFVAGVHTLGAPVMKRYLALRKRLLGLETLGMQDLYCPMVSAAETEMTYEKAKELVLGATEVLGEEYRSLLLRAFRERWVDVYETKAKTTGAYSCGVYGVHPYVLLNFSGRLDDAFTLAHELGHSMHSYLSDRTQTYADHDYSIMAAEVASTVNEVLLTKYLLRTVTDRSERIQVLNHFLEGFRTTVFRQALFAEFEKQAHDLDQAEEPLNAKVLSELFGKLNRTYYEGVETSPLYDFEWARIPHFYNAFYVYQYATGFSLAVAIVKYLLETGDASGYLKFLSSGGSDYPIEELKFAHVDLSNPEQVLRDAFAEMDATIEELENLLK